MDAKNKAIRSLLWVGGLLAVALGITVIGGGRLNAKPEGTTRGFLVTRSGLAGNSDPMETKCPGGVERTVEETFLATLSPAERERILRPENAVEYGRAWKETFITGPGGENVCNNAASFLNDPRYLPYNGVKSNASLGLNLDGTPDGKATSMTCGHTKFEGLGEDAAVDNQLFRATGCTKGGGGGGLTTFLIELRGLDDLLNDDSVEVGLYSTADVILQSQTGAASPNQTLRVSPNPKWRNEVKGRIVNGQLVTDVADRVYLHWPLSTWGLFGEASELELRRVRMKLELRPDGGLTGFLGAYRPIGNISTIARCCKASASTANINCASEHKTFAMMADGDPDPETGKCSTISASHRIVGIPAFVVHDAKGTQ